MQSHPIFPCSAIWLLIFAIRKPFGQHFNGFFFVVGQIMSATYYTITPETMEKKLLSEELIGEVLQRASKKKSKAWNFAHEKRDRRNHKKIQI
ncbi:MAG TPA: hypothetical protein VMZ49_06480 [Patescibacteria group bacterium]|nr:hypothetical protein [Patescibacteria group bacterium]